jgi:endonuclease YncB( thermonuclease family)
MIRMVAMILGACLVLGCQRSERVKALAANELIVQGHWIKLHGVDAPREANAACPAERDAAEMARLRLAQIALGARGLEFRKTGMVCPLWVRCDAFVSADGVDLSARMIEEGLLYAKGEAPRDWCAASRSPT